MSEQEKNRKPFQCIAELAEGWQPAGSLALRKAAALDEMIYRKPIMEWCP
jgi:hypothetical protein